MVTLWCRWGANEERRLLPRNGLGDLAISAHIFSPVVAFPRPRYAIGLRGLTSDLKLRLAPTVAVGDRDTHARVGTLPQLPCRPSPNFPTQNHS